MYKYTVVYLYNGALFTNIGKYKMNGSQKHYATCGNPDTKEYIMNDSFSMKFKIGKGNYGTRNKNSGCLWMQG